MGDGALDFTKTTTVDSGYTINYRALRDFEDIQEVEVVVRVNGAVIKDGRCLRPYQQYRVLQFGVLQQALSLRFTLAHLNPYTIHSLQIIELRKSKLSHLRSSIKKWWLDQLLISTGSATMFSAMYLIECRSVLRLQAVTLNFLYCLLSITCSKPASSPRVAQTKRLKAHIPNH